MLVSDKYEFVVAMPTKTGTNSLRAVVDGFHKAGGSGSVATLLKGEAQTRHRILPPPGKENYTRYMMVRDPIDRLISMYEYLRRKDWEWAADQILHHERTNGREAGWLFMLNLITMYRDADGYYSGDRKAHGIRPYMWTDTLSEMYEFMGGGRLVLPVHLEDFASDWDTLLAENGVEEDELFQATLPKRNSSPVAGRLFEDRAAYLAVDGASDLIESILASDVYDFGYDLSDVGLWF